jgi:hypothetical protein
LLATQSQIHHEQAYPSTDNVITDTTERGRVRDRQQSRGIEK